MKFFVVRTKWLDFLCFGKKRDRKPGEYAVCDINKKMLLPNENKDCLRAAKEKCKEIYLYVSDHEERI